MKTLGIGYNPLFEFNCHSHFEINLWKIRLKKEFKK